MRSLKFRIWSEKDKKYDAPLFVVQHDYESDPPITKIDPEGEFLFEQFTGLLDKSGKEIYEGDIVRDTSSQKLLIIKWGARSCECCNLVVGYDVGWEMIGGDGEIIGNIHQNPDLLKG